MLAAELRPVLKKYEHKRVEFVNEKAREAAAVRIQAAALPATVAPTDEWPHAASRGQPVLQYIAHKSGPFRTARRIDRHSLDVLTMLQYQIEADIR